MRERKVRQEGARMRVRPGFARLLPLIVLTGLAAGTIALLASPRAVQTDEEST